MPLLVAPRVPDDEPGRRSRRYDANVPAHRVDGTSDSAGAEAPDAADVLRRLEAGEEVVVAAAVDAYGVASGSADLVGAARAAGYAVASLPAPSPALVALAGSGLPTDRFVVEDLDVLDDEALAAVLAEPCTVVLACTDTGPARDRVRAVAGAGRTIVPAGGADRFFLVVAGAGPVAADPESGLAVVLAKVADGARLKDACRDVAALSGLSSKDLYDAALAARRSGS